MTYLQDGSDACHSAWELRDIDRRHWPQPPAERQLQEETVLRLQALLKRVQQGSPAMVGGEVEVEFDGCGKEGQALPSASWWISS